MNRPRKNPRTANPIARESGGNGGDSLAAPRAALAEAEAALAAKQQEIAAKDQEFAERQAELGALQEQLRGRPLFDESVEVIALRTHWAAARVQGIEAERAALHAQRDQCEAARDEAERALGQAEIAAAALAIDRLNQEAVAAFMVFLDLADRAEALPPALPGDREPPPPPKARKAAAPLAGHGRQPVAGAAEPPLADQGFESRWGHHSYPGARRRMNGLALPLVAPRGTRQEVGGCRSVVEVGPGEGAAMDITIRNLDEAAYRELEERAALAGKTVSELVNDAIRGYLTGARRFPKCGSLRDLVPEPYPEGCERLSEEIDAVVYGA